MSSTKEDGTAVAAEQLGAMSLGESVEIKDNESEPASKNGTPTKLLCSACGEKSDALKKCTACKCVWYCDKECQNRHRKEHRKECKRIKKELDKRGGKLDLGTEKDLGPLPDLPPRDECPICMRAFPLNTTLRTYVDCCGKSICGGCDYQHQMNSEERAAERGLTTAAITCAFCRTPVPESDEEMLARRRKRVERNDPDAILSHASDYDFGTTGLPVDHAKCVDLHRQSADLGSPSAQFQLGNFLYDGAMGLGQNKEEALKFWKKAAEGGHVVALYNLGCIEGRNGNNIAAMRHWRSSASGGMRGSMEGLIMYFEGGLLRHGDLAVTLQAMYLARAEMKSEDRDQFIEFLKMGGENVGYDGSRGSFRIRK